MSHRAQKQYDERRDLLPQIRRPVLERQRCVRRGAEPPAISAPLYLDNGHFDEAEEEFNVALDAARDAGEGRGIAMQMRNLAVLSHMRGATPRKPAKGCGSALELCVEIEAHTEALELRVLMGQIGCQ